MQNHRRISTAARCVACASAVLFTAFQARTASAVNWKGLTTDWNTATNWSPNGIPNSGSTPVTFGNTGAGTVNISSSVSAQSLTFDNSTGNYTLTSSSGQSLTVNAITLASNVTTNDTINLTSTSTNGSLLFATTSNLTITNNAVGTNANLTIGASTIIGTSGLGGVIFQGPGITSFDGSFSANALLAVVGGLTLNGPGVLDYAGNGTSLAGLTTLNGGALFLDFRNSIAPKAANGATLVLDNGVLELVANGTTAVAQSYTGGTTINAGQTDIQAVSSFGTVTLSTFTITRNVGGTVDFTPTTGSTTFNINTNSGTTNGLLGTGPAYATVAGGATWASVTSTTGGSIVGLADASYGVNNFTSNVNTDVTAAVPTSNFTTNSLRFNTGNLTLTLTGTNTLQSGGVLVTPSATGAAINGGILTAPGSGELLFHVYSDGGLVVGSTLVSTTGLTKTGPGYLTLSGANTGLTGPININRGNLIITTTAAVNSSSALNFNDDRTGSDLQEFDVNLGDNVNGTVSPAITLSAFSTNDYGTYIGAFNAGSTVTLSGLITSSPGLTTPVRFRTTSDASGFNLTNTSNSFTGNISVYSGFLGIPSDAVLGNAANTLVLDVSNPSNGGLIFLNSGITIARPVQIVSPTRIVSNGTDSNTISGVVSGGGQLVKDGTGTLILSNAGNTFSGGIFINAGTLSPGVNGGIASNNALTINAGGTFSTAGTGSIQIFSTITLNGGTYRVPTGSQNSVTNQLNIGTAGGSLDLTGTTSSAFAFTGVNPSATIAGDSTWSSPANQSIVAVDNPVTTNVIITINSGVTLTDGVAFYTPTSHGFTITGGGTLFQNSDAANQVNFNAPITVSSGSIYRVNDISTNGHGDLGTGTFTLDDGNLEYAGATATTTKPIALAANGYIFVDNAATTLTDSGAISGPGNLYKHGAGTLNLAVANSYTLATWDLEGTLLVTNTSGSATGTGLVHVGATLGGSGTISGTVAGTGAPFTIAPSATLTGNTATTLTLGGLTTDSTATLAFNLKTPGPSSVNDQIIITSPSALTLNGGKIQIANTSTGKDSLGYYKLIQYNGSIQGAGIASLILPTISNNIAYFLDTTHDPGYIDLHRGFLGDSNDDGIVNAIDLGILATNYNSTTANWSTGDYNGDGIVNAIDLGILATNYNAVIGASTDFASAIDAYPVLEAADATTSVPEPDTLAILSLGALTLRAKRRRPRKS